MPEIDFHVESIDVARHCVSPLLLFQLRLSNAVHDEMVAGVALQCQIQIEAARRRYSPDEEDGLRELFGEAERWAQTLRTLLWTHASVMVPGFDGECLVELPVPCTFDFNVAVTKYFAALKTGEVPLLLQFSGTVFVRNEDGGLQVSPIPWHKEVGFRLPVQVWKDMMAHYYPNGVWLCLNISVIDRLRRYKVQRGLATWEQALGELLNSVGED